MSRDYFYGISFTVIAVCILSLALRGGIYFLAFWPALSIGIVAIAYFTNDSGWFGKQENGSRKKLITILMFPYLTIIQSVWRLQISISGEPAIHYVNSYLAVSRRLKSCEIPAKVDKVCDLTCEFVDPKILRMKPGYYCHPILDAGACSATELIDLARKFQPSSDQLLLIHCANGHGRTGMFAAVWLLTHGFVATVDDAIKMLKSVRPGISMRSRQYQLVVEAFKSLREADELGE